MTNYRRLEPCFGDLPFFSPVLKGMIAIGSFVKVDGVVHRVISCDLSKDPSNGTIVGVDGT